MNGFIDIHHHLVYGLDDGAQTIEDGLRMARAAAENGTRLVLGTTHVSPGVKPFDDGLYRARLDELNARCREEGVPLEILPGAEILYTDATCRFLREGRVRTLAGTDYVLVEFLPNVRYEALRGALERILRTGCLPVLAHVERYTCLAGEVRRCERLQRDLNVLFQMNCGSAIGGRWFLSDWTARRMLDAEIIDIVASDAHHPARRPTRMREAYDALCGRYGAAMADRMTGRDASGPFWREIMAFAQREGEGE